MTEVRSPPSAHFNRLPCRWLPEQAAQLEAVTHAGHFRALSLELDQICDKEKDVSLGKALTRSILTDRLDANTTISAGWTSFRIKNKAADLFRITTLSKFCADQSSVSYIDPHSSLRTGRKLLRKPREVKGPNKTFSNMNSDTPAVRIDGMTSSWSRSFTKPNMTEGKRQMIGQKVLPRLFYLYVYALPYQVEETIPYESVLQSDFTACARFKHDGTRVKIEKRPEERADDDIQLEREASRLLGQPDNLNSPKNTSRMPIKRQLKAFFVSGLWYDIGRLREADPELRSVPRGLEGRALLKREMLARTRFKEWRVNWSQQSTEISTAQTARRRNSGTGAGSTKNQENNSARKKVPWGKTTFDKMTRRKRVIKLVMSFLRTKLALEMDLVQYDDKEIFPVRAYHLANSKVFFMYVRQSRAELCNQMLAQQPNLVYQVDDRGRSALHLAVIMRSGLVFDMLLKHRPKLELEDSQGHRPLDYVLMSNQGYMLRQLLLHGAYPFSKVYSNPAWRARIYPTLTFMLDTAICLWTQIYTYINTHTYRQIHLYTHSTNTDKYTPHKHRHTH